MDFTVDLNLNFYVRVMTTEVIQCANRGIEPRGQENLSCPRTSRKESGRLHRGSNPGPYGPKASALNHSTTRAPDFTVELSAQTEVSNPGIRGICDAQGHCGEKNGRLQHDSNMGPSDLKANLLTIWPSKIYVCMWVLNQCKICTFFFNP